MSTEQFRTGGCQCGAVRFRAHGELGRPTLCHCRMCQKHFGGLFSVLVAVKGNVEWTNEEPSFFQSSVNIERGFCRRCGTPMVFRTEEGPELAVGTFDDRSDLAPQIQVNHGSRIAWVEEIFGAPIRDQQTDMQREEAIISFQHPDKEVDNWPAHGLKL